VTDQGQKQNAIERKGTQMLNH